MLLALAWVFPLTLPRPFAPAACGAAQLWHHARSPLPTGQGVPADRGLFPAETWECRSSCEPALPGLVPVGNGREGAAALCGGTARSGVAGTTSSTSTSLELALPSSSTCGALGSSPASWTCCGPSQLCPGCHRQHCTGDFCPTLVLDSGVCSCVTVLWLLTFIEPRLETPSTTPLGAIAVRKRPCARGVGTRRQHWDGYVQHHCW